MSTSLPISIVMGALPPQVRWTPQQLGDAIAQRLSLVTAGTYALFAAGTTEPASNVGPWFDGQSWFYWSNVTGDYQPIVLAPESLGYTIGANPPNPLTYSVWVETTAGGSPLAVKIYYSGAWVDVYAATLASYSTVAATAAAITAALASYSTTAAMNAAIAAAVAAIPGADFYPAQGIALSQSISINGTPVKIAFASAPINPSPSPFNTTTYRYVAPAGGTYQVQFSSQFDNNTGTAAGMEVIVGLYKNGASVGSGLGDIDNTPSPNGARWSPGFSGFITLATNDYIEIFAEVSDGVNTGLIDLTVAQFSISRISA